MKLFYFLIFSLFLFISQTSNAQCSGNEQELHVIVSTDNYPYETSWEVISIDGFIYSSGQGEDADEVICIPEDECVYFNIYDSYGDGLFDYQGGGFWIYLNGNQIAAGGDFEHEDFHSINCPPGSGCDTPITIEDGDHFLSGGSGWYAFTPEETGFYHVSTCEDNTCDTKIGIYEYCNLPVFDDTQVGTIYFDDNSGGCGEQAHINAALEEGVTYLIRVFESEDGECDDQINFSIEYQGPVTGCTDSGSCNYNPLATIDDGSCVYPGDPNCTDGPDLWILEDVVRNSLYPSTLTVSPVDCYIEEGCLSGYGVRDLLRFSTHIKNIGTQDYYIGNEDINPGAFSYGNCHGHWHYEGYAEYLLYTPEGTEIPVGFKTGFCVLDLECDDGGDAQYGCNNMGISADCGDIYSSGLACQWIDITDVPDGDYTLVVRINWQQAPDALGRVELDYSNNWAQVCINIDRSGGLDVEIYDECTPFVDCNGVEYGGAEIDCEGVCGGSKIAGDLNLSEEYEVEDVEGYIQGILAETIDPTSCTDLDSDGNITVADAALLSRCNISNGLLFNPIDIAENEDCDLPTYEVVNIYDTVTFTLQSLNTVEQYFEVHMKNPSFNTVGYQLEFSGFGIVNAVNLSGENYPVDPEFIISGNTIIGLSYLDSTIQRSNSFQPLLRIYYSNVQDEICLSSVVDVVNENYEVSIPVIEDACFTTSGIAAISNPYVVKVAPNPFNETTVLHIGNWLNDKVSLQILDLRGRVIRDYGVITSDQVTINRKDLSNGMYFYRLSGTYNQTGRLVITD